MSRRSYRKWLGDDELDMLKLLVGYRFHAYDIARIIGRPPSSVYSKCKLLGLALPYRTKRWPIPGGDQSTWDPAQCICAFANVPMPLAQLVCDISFKHRLSVKEVRGNRRLSRLVKCRFEIAATARSQGYSLPLIGRAMNRDHSTVLYAVRKLGLSTENSETVGSPRYFADAA